MKVTFCFDRAKPFGHGGGNAPDAVIRRYERRLASALSAHYPEHEIVVRHVVDENGDVVFEPANALTDAERLELALEMRRIAHRLADEMFGERFEDARDD
jgi:hypothetical protein